MSVLISYLQQDFPEQQSPHLTSQNNKVPTLIPIPESKVYGAKMGPTWVLSSPDGPMLAP